MRIYLSILILAVCLTSCESLTKEVEVDLPPFESQLIVESYLMKGQPVQVSVMETKDYFKDIDTPFVNDAVVTLEYNGRSETLISEPFINPFTMKYVNYHSTDSLHLDVGELYTISVKDSKGREARGTTTWMEPVKIDSVAYRNPTDLYNVVAYFDDPPGKNFYRFRVRRVLPGLVNDTIRQDYFADDELFDGEDAAFGSGYNYKKGDLLEVTLFHISEEYYDFLSTVSAASSANGNPFAQPAAIKSNVTGGIGIVTGLAFDRVLVKIE